MVYKDRFQFTYLSKGYEVKIDDKVCGSTITIPTKILVEFVYGRTDRAMEQLRKMTPGERDVVLSHLEIGEEGDD